jgi:hypothetical protein
MPKARKQYDYPPVKVGDHLTYCYPADQYPAVVVAVNGNEVRCAEIDIRFIKPSHFEGPFPVFSHRLTDEEVKAHVIPDRTFGLRRRAGHYEAGNRSATVVVGRATYYRNHASD